MKNLMTFSVAKGSDITPPELARAGIKMLDHRFYPNDIELVKNLLTDYIVWDESTDTRSIFRFERAPY